MRKKGLNLRFQQHFSGSSGNLYSLTNSQGGVVVIDPGVRWKDLLYGLSYSLDVVDFCLLSHSHMDHAKSAAQVMNAGIDLYASKPTLEALGLSEQRRAHILEPDRKVTIGCWTVYPFEVQHGKEGEMFHCPGTLGFVISCEGKSMLFVTDASCIEESFETKFDIVAIQASYDMEVLTRMVEQEEINETVAKRMLESHMEVGETLRYLKESCDLSNCAEIHLIHLSGTKLDKEKIRQRIENETFIRTVIL